jgi:prepilin-type processing-associated H-X9-DG protein
MLSENMRAVTWTYEEQVAYQRSNSVSTQWSDRKYHFGFCWEQPEEIAQALTSSDPKQYYRINAFAPDTNSLHENYTSVSEIQQRDAFPTSNHPSGINVAFVGGSVQFVTDQMEPRVYGQLMTSNRNTSDLYDASGYEKNMPPLSESEY